MRRFGIIVLVVIVIGMLATNPDLETHRAAVKESYNEMIGREVDSLNLGEGLSAIGKSLGNGIAGGILEQKVSRQNLVLFSLTKFKRRDSEEIIGIGIFGQVFLFEKPNLTKQKDQDA